MIDIKSALQGDNLFLAQVCRSVSSMYQPIMPGAFEKQASKYEAGGLPKTYDVSIISLGEVPIGFIGLKGITDQITYLTALYFLMDQQRQGWGRQALGLLIERLSIRGIKEIVLLVHRDAYWAVNFYKNNGFTVVTEDLEEIKKYADSRMEPYALPSTILMTRSL